MTPEAQTSGWKGKIKVSENRFSGVDPEGKTNQMGRNYRHERTMSPPPRLPCEPRSRNLTESHERNLKIGYWIIEKPPRASFPVPRGSETNSLRPYSERMPKTGHSRQRRKIAMGSARKKVLQTRLGQRHLRMRSHPSVRCQLGELENQQRGRATAVILDRSRRVAGSHFQLRTMDASARERKDQ